MLAVRVLQGSSLSVIGWLRTVGMSQQRLRKGRLCSVRLLWEQLTRAFLLCGGLMGSPFHYGFHTKESLSEFLGILTVE